MISVVIPVYRSAATLRELHARLCRALAGGEPFELIFVNDGSPDASADVLSELAGDDPRVAIVTLPRNLGQHAAVLQGLARAGGHAVIVLDADLQDRPEAIPMLLDALRRGCDAAFAGRRGEYDTLGRRLSSRLFWLLLRRMCGTPADAGLYVAMNRAVVTRLLAFPDPGPLVVAMIGCTGLRLTSIPVPRDRRCDGRSSYSVWQRIALAAATVAWVARTRRRAATVRARASSTLI